LSFAWPKQMPFNLEEYETLEGSNMVWIWKGILPISGSILLYGNPKVGKSKLVLSLAEAISDTEIGQYLGLAIENHGPILYVQLDTPRSLWQSGYCSFIKSPTARKNIYISDREMPSLPSQFDIREPEHQRWLRGEVEAAQPIAVIVDTLRRMHRGNENESDVMSNVLNGFIEATQPAALIFLTHKKKAQMGDIGQGTSRGSSALSGAVDALVNMTKKALYIEARSDVEEEIPIIQGLDGTFTVGLDLGRRSHSFRAWWTAAPRRAQSPVRSWQSTGWGRGWRRSIRGS
jgi:RecA-family ATPase